MQKLLLILFILLLSLTLTTKGKDIVVTIKPLHSLVTGVLGNSRDASLLLDGNVSVHNFQLKPSQLRLLQEAKVIFYIDNSLETFLVRIFRTLPANVAKFAITEHNGVKILAKRSSGAWHHHHRDHDHHHLSHNNDMHLWLDPRNASQIVLFIAEKLSVIYPQNRHIYQANAQKLIKKIDVLNATLQTKLADVKQKPFIVFHDAYQYFERAYGLTSVGAITLNPSKPQSAKHLQTLRKQLIDTGARCVFSETQFSPKLVKTLTSNIQVKTAILDPLGANLNPGQNLYFKLINNLADNIKQCLLI